MYYKLYFRDVSGELADVLEVTLTDGSDVLYTGTLFRAYRREQAGAGDSDAFALPELQSGAEIAAQAAPFTPAGRAAAWTCTAAAIWAVPAPVPSVRRRGR